MASVGSVGNGFSIETLVADPSALFPEPPTPDSPQASLGHSALPLLEPRNFLGKSLIPDLGHRKHQMSLEDLLCYIYQALGY